MKKIAAILLVSLIFVLVFAQAVSAGLVTTEAPQSTAATTQAGREPELLHGPDITKPVTVCLIIVCACIIYGIHELRKHKNDGL